MRTRHTNRWKRGSFSEVHGRSRAHVGSFFRWLKGLSSAGVVLGLSGCLSPPVHGLRPIEPPLTYGAVGDGAPYFLEYAFVGNGRPVFKWEPFPSKSDRRADKEGVLQRVKDVRYDLRIWRAEDGYPAELVYWRDALTNSEHEVETYLPSATRYFWSVRARFTLDGNTRVTHWSYAKRPWAPEQLRDYGTSDIRRVDEIPAYNYFRFRRSGLFD